MENLVDNYLLNDSFSTKNSSVGLPVGTTLSFVKPKTSSQNYKFDTSFNIDTTPISSSSSLDTPSTTNGITDVFGGSKLDNWIPKLDMSEDLIFVNDNIKPTTSVQGTKAFNDAFDAVQARLPEIRKYRDFLTKLAQRESSFNPKARAGNSSGTALGYFQFMPYNRKGLSEQTFTNNPELQIEMAYKLLNVFKNSFDASDFAKANAKGYSESAIIAGAWLSGPQGVKKFLNTGYSRHDNLGTTVKSYMDKFNKLI